MSLLQAASSLSYFSSAASFSHLGSMLAWHSTLAGRGQRRFDNLVAAVTIFFCHCLIYTSRRGSSTPCAGVEVCLLTCRWSKQIANPLCPIASKKHTQPQLQERRCSSLRCGAPQTQTPRATKLKAANHFEPPSTLVLCKHVQN